MTEDASQENSSTSCGKIVVEFGAMIVSAAALGALSGFLTGSGGPYDNSAVMAAVIPAVLSLGGGSLAVVAIYLRGTVSAMLPAAFIVTFCCCFYVASVQADFDASERIAASQKQARDEARLAYVEARRAYRKELEECSRVELWINSVREDSGLDALPREYFCPKRPVAVEHHTLPTQAADR